MSSPLKKILRVLLPFFILVINTGCVYEGMTRSLLETERIDEYKKESKGVLKEFYAANRNDNSGYDLFLIYYPKTYKENYEKEHIEDDQSEHCIELSVYQDISGLNRFKQTSSQNLFSLNLYESNNIEDDSKKVTLSYRLEIIDSKDLPSPVAMKKGHRLGSPTKKLATDKFVKNYTISRNCTIPDDATLIYDKGIPLTISSLHYSIKHNHSLFIRIIAFPFAIVIDAVTLPFLAIFLG